LIGLELSEVAAGGGKGLTMLEYRAAYTRCPDSGWFVAEVLDFPGTISQGRTLEHARRMLRDALREMAESFVEQGKALPLPDPKVTDPDAEVLEPIRLSIRIQSGAAS
jgi:predicted RNase H-like HicB family nuclease